MNEYFPDWVKKVALFTPCGFMEESDFLNAKIFLESLGLEVLAVYGSQDFNRGGTDQGRFETLKHLWNETDVQLLIAARGGYGAVRLLEYFEEFKSFLKNDKILVGHSDLSVFHLLFDKFSVGRTASGMLGGIEMLKSYDAFSWASLRASLDLDKSFNFLDQQKLELRKVGSCSGKIYPVTLSVLTYLLHLEDLPSFDNVILFLEDVNEPAYKIDCFMWQLKSKGILGQISALVWGDFSGVDDEEYLESVIVEYSALVDGPVVSGSSFGHQHPRLNLPVGERMNLVLNEQGKSLHLC